MLAQLLLALCHFMGETTHEVRTVARTRDQELVWRARQAEHEPIELTIGASAPRTQVELALTVSAHLRLLQSVLGEQSLSSLNWVLQPARKHSDVSGVQKTQVDHGSQRPCVAARAFASRGVACTLTGLASSPASPEVGCFGAKPTAEFQAFFRL